MDYQLDLNRTDFLNNNWQKRPVLLKRAFKNFIDPLSPDELAGLAMESEVESRLVSQQEGKWQVSHGPFESYDQPEQFRQWFGEFFSQSRHELDIAPPEPPYQPDEIYDALQRGDRLTRLGGLRVLRIGDAVFINGEQQGSAHPAALRALADKQTLGLDDFAEAIDDPAFLAQLTELVNNGYWFFSTA